MATGSVRALRGTIEQTNLGGDGGNFVPAEALVAWYNAHRRDLPWRRTRDPYAIWLSETMLQQTRVDTVIPYYHAFLTAYPTVADLAAAEEADVLKRWQGLGYYSRARNLHRAAQAVVREHGGSVPDTADAFAALPGVGPYTTGAVMSIAFDRPMPAVDGNVLRVMSRYLGVQEPITDTSSKRTITAETAAWLQQVPPNELTQALMELGALVCVPRDPHCDACPLQPGCVAVRDGLTHVLPRKAPKPERRRITVAALWCERDGRVLLEQRPSTGLLASMWQLPAVEVDGAEAAAVRGGDSVQAAGDCDSVQTAGVRKLQHLFGGAGVIACSLSGEANGGRADAAQPTQAFAEVARLKHIFTHLEWDVRVLRPVSWDAPAGDAPAGCVWADEAGLEKLALPRVYEKVLAKHHWGGA